MPSKAIAAYWGHGGTKWLDLKIGKVCYRGLMTIDASCGSSSSSKDAGCVV